MEEMRLTEDDMKGFTYILWWKDQNKQYYGVKFARNCKTECIGTTYFSSSKKVKEYWKEHGDPVIIIDAMFTDIDEAREYEKWILDSNEVHKNDDWLNLRASKAILMNEDMRRRISEAKKGRKLSEEHKSKLGKAGVDNKRYNRMIYNYKNNLTGETFTGTQSDFKNAHGLHHSKISALSNLKRVSHKGWVLVDDSGNCVRKRVMSYNKKDNIYVFFHPAHGEVTCTQYELHKIYGVTFDGASCLVNSKIATSRGWSCLREEGSNKLIVKLSRYSSRPLHIFKHDDVGEIRIRQRDICIEFGLCKTAVSNLIKGKKSIYKGWTYHGISDDQID